ncbi:hypothetical protein P7C70_g8601, partial [Phenoliferia sp. Uapishka_3]
MSFETFAPSVLAKGNCNARAASQFGSVGLTTKLCLPRSDFFLHLPSSFLEKFLENLIRVAPHRNELLNPMLGNPIMNANGQLRSPSSDAFAYTAALLQHPRLRMFPPGPDSDPAPYTDPETEYYRTRLSALGLEKKQDFELQALVLFTLIQHGASEELVAVALERLGKIVGGDIVYLDPVEEVMSWMKNGGA